MDTAPVNRLRLGTQNFEKLGTPKKAQVPPPGPETEDRYAAAIDNLQRMDADVVVATEIPSEQVLEELSRRMGERAYPHRQFVVTNDPADHHMAVLSRYPIEEVQTHREAPFSRGLFMARVQVPGYPLRVYGIHYKANPFYLSPQTPEKTALAQATRGGEVERTSQVLAADAERAPHEAYAVLGDGNADPNSPEMQRLLQGAGAPLVDAFPADAVTHPATGTRKDYVLVDPASGGRVVSAEVLEPSKAGRAPDHNPTMLTIDVIHS